MTIQERKAQIVKREFSDALEALMLTRDFEEISVNEISERAGMSRTTFYRYFQDKYELSRWRLEFMVVETDRNAVDHELVESTMKKMMLEIGAHKPYYRKLFSYAGQNSLEDFFYSVFYDWSRHLSQKAPGQKDNYILQYNASGTTGAMKRWLNDKNPIALEDFSTLLLKMAI